MPAIVMIQSVKSISYFSAQMGRVFVSPFLPISDENLGVKGEKFLQIFENRDNIEKLINAIEEMAKAEEEKKSAEKETEKTPNKKWWRRFLSL